MIDRLASGNERLDRILDGGLPGNAIHLIAGPPGSGKTILAEQYAFANATVERPAVYFSTVSEPLDKLVRFGQTLEFFDVLAIGQRVFYEDLGDDLEKGGLRRTLERIRTVLRERCPGILIIDSFKALTAYADSHRDFRSFLYQLAADTGAVTGSSFWLGEYDLDTITGEPEFAIADSILGLGSQRAGERSSRVLEVLKLRGSGYLSGQHAYRISARGLSVFPRLADTIDTSSYELGAGRLSTGIDALDEMLTDGYWPGSSTLCAGPSGIGKTLLGLHFVVAGAAAGERGIVASLQENPTQLTRVAAAFGWTLDESVTMMYRSPVDLYVDEWIYELLGMIDRLGVKRVLIDSLTDLLFASREEIRFREYMYSLTQRCSRLGVSLFMTSELRDLFAVNRLSEYGVSHLSDNVLVLQYLRDGATIRRAITPLKTRASRNDPRMREFTIGAGGITLADSTKGRSAH
ncbi:MAG TPA: ATPase domain-containing protein [Solirubrobacteraceae bacterium]|nr:ATPase domain-containing protein [Solirubrobacteraceae bacterium]